MSRPINPPTPPEPGPPRSAAGWSSVEGNAPPAIPRLVTPPAPPPAAPPLAAPPPAQAALNPVGDAQRLAKTIAAAAPDRDAALRSRVAQIKRRQQRKWQWLTRLPAYKTLETIWLKVAKVRDAGVDLSEEERKRELPAWLVSFLVHVALLMILALIPLAGMVSSQLPIIVGDFNGEGAIELAMSPEGSDISLEAIDLPMANIVMNSPEVDLTLPSISNSLTPARATDELASNLAGMSIEQGLAGRSGSLKGALLSKFGGNAATEAAVAAGLKWLAKNQLSDGGWSLTKPYSDGATNEDRTGATAMALNAFLGAGHTHMSGEYKSNVARGLKFLVKRQDTEGFFAANEPSHNRTYSQALATITVCEAYGLTRDSELKIPATRAIKYAQWSQGRQKGWRYDPQDDSDLSVTGWYLMALMTGRMAGLDASEETIRSTGQYVESVSHDYGAAYSYTRADRPSLTMTAEGLLCRQYLGWPRSHPALQKAIEQHLLTNTPEMDQEMVSVYYWYYATQVLHHVGGKPWEKWNERMKLTLPAMQEKKGKEEGSWYFENDQFAPAGGRLYLTCFCIYCLEVYYRHLALYDTQEATIKPRNRPTDESSPDSGAPADQPMPNQPMPDTSMPDTSMPDQSMNNKSMNDKPVNDAPKTGQATSGDL